MRVALVFLALAAVMACRASAGRTAPAPLPPCPPPAVDVSGWARVDQGIVAFRLPPGFRQVGVDGGHVYLEEFRAAGGARVSSMVGLLAGDAGPDENRVRYQQCGEVIGGRAATVATFVLGKPCARQQCGRQVAAATWSNLTDADTTRGVYSKGVNFLLWAETRDPRRLPDLLAMLRTVEFPAR